MRFFKRLRKITSKKAILSIGNFDGLHLGHRDVLKRVKELAEKEGCFSCVLTFKPHPRKFFGSESFKVLNTSFEKKYLFQKLGIDFLFELKFSKWLASLSPLAFLKYLRRFLKIKKIVVGFNFAFGFGKSGHLRKLRKLGKLLNFEVEVRKAINYKRRIVSSSLVRKLINSGNLEEASLILKEYYPVFGKVIRGSGLSKSIGFPTANLLINEEKILPPEGVYLAKVEYKNKSRPALVNINFKKPKASLFEVYILNFNKNIYGKILKVFLIKKLREERDFRTTHSLKRQIEKDILKAKKILKNLI